MVLVYPLWPRRAVIWFQRLKPLADSVWLHASQNPILVLGENGCMKSLPKPFQCPGSASGWQLRMWTTTQDPGSLGPVSATPSSLHLRLTVWPWSDLGLTLLPLATFPARLSPTVTSAPFTPAHLLYPGKLEIISIFWIPCYSMGALWICRNTSDFSLVEKGRNRHNVLPVLVYLVSLDSPWCIVISLATFWFPNHVLAARLPVCHPPVFFFLRVVQQESTQQPVQSQV